MAASNTHFDREDIDVALVERLITAQFPQWADLQITPAVPQGWDNKTFRLGTEMSVRLPSAAPYAQQVEKEHRWLPELAPHLPLPIPVPLAKGAPAEGYPFNWSVYQWLEGETASTERIDDLIEFATTLADFLAALQRIDPAGGPPPGRHNFFRGGPLAVYDAETRQAIAALDGRIDTDAATAVWEAALRGQMARPARLGPRRRRSREPAGHGGSPERRHRLRDLERGRPLVRPGDRVDPPRRGEPGRLPRGSSAGRRDLGTGPRLGAVEVSDHARRTHRYQPP